MINLRTIAIALAAGMLTAAAPPPDYGDEPSWDSARSTVEAALRAKMIDPSSTRIRWPYRFTRGFTQLMFDQPRYGWWTCGRIESKGYAGDYVGEVWFTVLMRDGKVVTLDRGNTLEVTHASAHCEDAVRSGELKPAAVVAVSGPLPTAAAAADGEKLGIGFVPTPDGARIQLVVAGSPAERAGLRVGQLIEAVNGAPLKGLAAPEMIKAVLAKSPSVFLSIAGGGDVKVTRRTLPSAG
jgi:hypothetical protein